MTNPFKHLIENPFISATGAAALVHSTWSLGTLMSGAQPEASINIHFIGWLVPALLIAFALDIGQIVTSSKIRHDGLSVNRGITFGVFAFATYYLQLLYCIHHVPAMDLSAGVRGDWQAVVTLIRDASIWIIPALLPLSTLLYTLSGNEVKTATVATVEQSNYNIEFSGEYLPIEDHSHSLPEPIIWALEEPIEAQIPRPLSPKEYERLTGNIQDTQDADANIPTTPKSKKPTGTVKSSMPTN